MSRFVHQRHKPPDSLDMPRELLLVCAPLRSNVNFSRIARAASCCGVRRIIGCGHPRLDPEIARVEEPDLSLETHRTLPPVLAQTQTRRLSIGRPGADDEFRAALHVCVCHGERLW